jgi:PAS domain containing serine/threonine kinase
MILLSGKVVEIFHKNGQKIPVSLWIRQIDGHDDGKRCIAVAEPVERRVAQLSVDENGIILSGDNECLILFQLESFDKFVGTDVKNFVPALQLPDEKNSSDIPKHIKKQRATGKTKDGVSFPLCLMISLDQKESSFIVTLWVYSNLSGLIVIDENSIIENCNHHFSNLMFGYSQSKIIGQNIFKLIPNFGQEFEYIDPRRDQRSPSIENEESETETDHILMNDPFSITPKKDPFKIALDFTSARSGCIKDTENNKNVINISHDELTPVNETSGQIPSESENETRKRSLGGQVGMQLFNYNYADGKYKGEALHYDGNIIEIVYTIHKQTLPSTNNTIYLGNLHKISLKISMTIFIYVVSKLAVWICRDPDEYRCEDPDEEKQFNLTLTLNSITSTISLGGATMKNEKSCVSNTNSSIMMTSATAGTNTLANITSTSRPHSLSVVSQCEDEQINGEYSKHYTTLKQIGKGTF